MPGNHHFGGEESDLKSILVADGLQELFARAAGGSGGTLHFVHLTQREGFG